MNEYFRFKHFVVRQDRTAMKVGTDGVLLGAWASLVQAGSILDIGTGTGLLALMAAQRNPSARIDAVEINEEAAAQARENVAASPWSDRITVFHQSVRQFSPGKKYRHVICNPPFFIRSTPAPDKGRNTARHCRDMSHSDLIRSAVTLLEAEGRLSLILPPEEAASFRNEALANGLHPARLTGVRPNPEKPFKRILMEFSTSPANFLPDELTIEIARHCYTPEYTALTREFYLYL